jgi:hypothetical protein
MTRAAISSDVEEDIKPRCLELLPIVKSDLETEHEVQLPEFNPLGPIDPPYKVYLS